MTEVILCTAGYDNTIRLWSVVDGSCISTVQHNESHINRLAVSPDKQWLAVAGNPCIRLYSLAKLQSKGTDKPENGAAGILEGHRGNVTALGWDTDSRWLWSASEDGTARLWNIAVTPADSLKGESMSVKGEHRREFPAKHAINDAALSPDQAELATVDERGVLRWWAVGSVNSSECLGELMINDECSDSDCSLSTGVNLPVPLQTVAYSPDGMELAVACKGTVYRLGREGGNGKKWRIHMKYHPHHSDYITRMAYSPDGGYLASCSSDHTCSLYSIDKGNVTRLEGHGDRWVWDCGWSADSAYLVTVGSDGTGRLWEVTGESVAPVAVFTGHGKAAVCVALNDTP